MVRDLNIPVEIVGCPTLRDPDGLALSSRNAYLTAAQRTIAGKLNVAMRDVAQGVAAGADPLAAAAQGRADLLAAGFDAVDYLEVRDAQTLSTALRPGFARRVLVAARLGGIRLIDNCAV
jgi:pantoate--beta-alanine ligase